MNADQTVQHRSSAEQKNISCYSVAPEIIYLKQYVDEPIHEWITLSLKHHIFHALI